MTRQPPRRSWRLPMTKISARAWARRLSNAPRFIRWIGPCGCGSICCTSPRGMRIAFILPTFTAGGAERVASLLCNYWVEQGHDVIALTFEGAGDERVYHLDGRVR